MRSEKSVNVNATIRNVFFPGMPLKDAVALIQAIPMSDRIDLANENPAHGAKMLKVIRLAAI